MQKLLGLNGVPAAAIQILESTLFENMDKEYHLGVMYFVSAMAVVPEGMRDAIPIDTKKSYGTRL